MAVDSPDVPEKEEEKEGEVEHAASSTSPPPPVLRSAEEIKAVARNYANCPLQNPDPGVWAVLTAISQKARQRPQGMNIILKREEHYIGRSAEDSFRLSDHAVSARHCRIYRRKTAVGDNGVVDTSVPVFLKDSSMNGTFLNWEKLSRSSPASRVQHGDIISFLGTPDSERAYAFVYRAASHSAHSKVSALKRKSEDQSVPESKRVKGLGIGAPDGPISLDDVRSLQRSNTELRKQVESHVLTIENMKSEALKSATRHEAEKKELKESISNSFIDKIKELQHILKVKQKELDDAKSVSAQYRDLIKDLNERLHASKQSRAEADEIINSQKAIISERAAQIDEERNQRRVEREKAAADLKSALHRAHLEAQEEIKRQADIYLQQQREQQEFIYKLQESEKESRLLVETLRSKLEDTRESFVTSEKKVRQVEGQLQEEQIASESNRKRSEVLELEIKKLKKDLENEKVAREEAWAKVSALELEIAAVIRELSIEKRRIQGARERIILRESQLRAFYSTTEEISALFAKQQEQLKAMQRTLEDEDNYDNRSTGFDLNAMAYEDDAQAFTRVQRDGEPSGQPTVNITTKDGKARMVHTVDDSSSNDDASVTEKHECDAKSPDDGENTQDLEGTSAERSVKGFGSDIDGIGTMVPEADGDGHAGETEGVPETESQGLDAGLDGQAAALQRCSNLAGDTIQLEDATQVQENVPQAGTPDGKNDHGSQSRLEDTETGTVRTADLLASEGLGSWANSTAPSVRGENDTPGCGTNMDACGDVGAAVAALCSFDAQAAVSQSSNAMGSGVARLTDQHRALNALLEIVAPEFEKQFPGYVSGASKNDALTDAETEEDSDDEEDDGEKSRCGDDDDEEDDGEKSRNGDDDMMIEDSVG